MSAKVVTLWDDDQTIIEKVEEMTMDTIDRLERPDRAHCDATLAALIPRFTPRQMRGYVCGHA